MNRVLRFIDWSRRHQLATAGCAAGYFVLVVLPHLQVGLFFQWVFSHYSRSQYQSGVLAVFAGLFVLIIPAFIRGMISTRRVVPVVVYLGMTLIMTAVSYNLLVIHAIELSHLPQYALLAVLIFPLVMRFGDTVFWTTLLGAVDEAYQYFYLAPDRTMQYDFNDVILNLLGAGFGVVFLLACGVVSRPRTNRVWYANPVVLTVLALAAGLAVMFQLDLLGMYPGAADQAAWGVVVKEYPAGFWSYIPHLRVQYHIILPIEGVFLTAMLLALYYPIDTLARYHHQTNPAQASHPKKAPRANY